MRYFAIYDLVGICVEDTYPWCNTLFINQGLSVESEDEYLKCKQKIRIVYEKNLNLNEVRFIGDGAYIGKNIYVDEHYGVRFIKKMECIELVVSQECNEWLVIAVQLSLLACNHTMIHAAALEKQGEVLLLPSWGGVGKTATVCTYIKEHGWKLLGDDLIIIAEKKALPFLKPFVIYPYHKKLFPELFSNGENHTIKNLKISSMMSRMIPGVKRMLRPFPRVLAYLRKHNPQSMRVNPKKIFNEEQISSGGVPFKTVWLERTTDEEITFSKLSAKDLASKAVTVSCVELFASKLESVYHMCGCGIFTFEEIFERMYNLIIDTVQDTDCSLLALPKSIDISDIGNVIYNNLDKE